MFAKSSLATATAFSIFSSASRRVSSIIAAPQCSFPSVSVPAYKSADPFAPNRAHHIALAHQVEDDDRQIIVHAQANRRRVHELQLTAQHIAVVEPVEQVGVGF